jgi:acyl-CoA reductase-like NAD-dependent aldehyde dehydrogenase
VHDSIYDTFVERAGKFACERKVAEPFEEEVSHGPIINQTQLEKVMRYIEMGKKEKARLVCGGNRMDVPGFFVENTVFADVTDEMYIATQDVQAPVMCIMRFSDLQDVLRRINKTKSSLGCGVVTQSLKSALRVAEFLKTGTVMVNCWSAIEPTTSFGGFKESGTGKELGEESLESYLETKTVIVRGECC